MPFNYYGFTSSSYYKGVYSNPINTLTIPIGYVGQPHDILKFSPNSFGTNESITFSFDYNLTVESPTQSDWTVDFKNQWFQSYMTSVGLKKFITSDVYQKLLNDFETLDMFKKLSGLSLAYVNQIPFQEIAIGCNSYENTFFQDWIKNNTQDPFYDKTASDMFGILLPGKHFISNVGKITYGGHSDFIWSFKKPFFFKDYILTGYESLENGGGNNFVEIKLAGNVLVNTNVKSHYVVLKNVLKEDPSKGLITYLRCLNEAQFDLSYLGPFCIGDVLTVLNNSVYTTRSTQTNIFTWTWYGGLQNIPTIWYLADVTNPCEDYKAIPIYDMLFPLRVISECKFKDFD